jgi:hypothetical protein
LFEQIGNSGPLPWHVRCELQNVRGGLPAAAIRTALNFIDSYSALSNELNQRPTRRNCYARAPASVLNRRKKIEQTPLRAAKCTELIEKKNVHLRRTARANTHI